MVSLDVEYTYLHGILTSHCHAQQSYVSNNVSGYCQKSREYSCVNVPGRLSLGTQLEMIVSAPIVIPAAPKPATARPTINIDEEVAAPQSKEPSSKIPKKAIKVHCFYD